MGDPIPPILGFPSGLEVKNPPAKQGTGVGSLGWENPLGEEMATRSSMLAWVIPWIEEPGGLESMGSQRVRHDLATQEQQTTNSTHRPLHVVSKTWLLLLLLLSSWKREPWG